MIYTRNVTAKIKKIKNKIKKNYKRYSEIYYLLICQVLKIPPTLVNPLGWKLWQLQLFFIKK